ncbi:MAG: hypothetical protein FGM57_01510 [Candidatus Taylorbacteria bacterium]|nr:hypothetical protein [Candidatus Taylorbacteria bacterium]
MKSPILFITFNRPEKTEQVFSVIRVYQPEKIYIASDGPRDNKPGEAELVARTRKIFDTIDWPCTVIRIFRETNLGCKRAVSESITEFFKHEEMGIILEDDCMPNPSFFEYCTEMLLKYKENESIFHVNGTNLLPASDLQNVPTSYYFTKNIHIWGWASWRRAWNQYDIDMKDIESQEQHIISQFENKKTGYFWISLFKHIRDKNINTWDAQWVYSILKNNGIGIAPCVNLIKNIGFDASATHTTAVEKDSPYIKETESMDTTHIIHPETIQVRSDLDTKIVRRLYIQTITQKILYRIKKIFV